METQPTWLDEFVARIPDDKRRADFLRYWHRLKRGNDEDELLQLVSFMSLLTSIMQDIPSECLRLAKELPKHPAQDRMDQLMKRMETVVGDLKDPAVSKRLEGLQSIVGTLERYGKNMELRLIMSIAMPAFLAGAFLAWFAIRLTH